jgi:hypothetical protein
MISQSQEISSPVRKTIAQYPKSVPQPAKFAGWPAVFAGQDGANGHHAGCVPDAASLSHLDL